MQAKTRAAALTHFHTAYNTTSMDKTTSSIEAFARQNCATILQRQAGAQPTTSSHRTPPEDRPRSYKCKICGRTFKSFQALGGHRANHSKIGKSGGGAPAKDKTVHKCDICGIWFPTGQTLGGHMRKHRPKSAKRREGEEDGGEEGKKKRVETGSLDGSKMAMRGVLGFDLNLSPVDQETVL